MNKNLLPISGAVAGVIGYLVFGNRLKALLKNKVKYWYAELINRESGLSTTLTRPATDLIMD